MRALEFRAWWKDTKRFLDCDEWYMTCSGAKYLHYAVMPYKDDNFIIEQYTGIKDKNGEMVYEGDIVLDCYDGDDAFIVEWDKDTASFVLTDTEHILNVSFDIFCPDKDLEIIGNIHENKELLEMRNNGRFSL